MNPVGVIVGIALLAWCTGTLGTPHPRQQEGVSFKTDIYPIIKRSCLPCHSEDNYNPSDLTLDDYAGLMKGGKHGSAVEAWNSQASIIIKKLSEDPPFGDKMPLIRKRPDGSLRQKPVSPEEIQRIAAWIDQGAKDN